VIFEKEGGEGVFSFFWRKGKGMGSSQKEAVRLKKNSSSRLTKKGGKKKKRTGAVNACSLEKRIDAPMCWEKGKDHF